MKKQIEEAPKITKIYEPIEVTDEMRKLADEMQKAISDEYRRRVLADEMQKAISDEYRRRVLADERKLEAVLKENGWRKSSDVAEEIFAEIDKLLAVDRNGEANLDVRALAELKKKYTEGGRDKIAEFGKYSPLSWKYTEGGE